MVDNWNGGNQAKFWDSFQKAVHAGLVAESVFFSHDFNDFTP